MSETKQDVEGVLVTVIESGSTNTVGYTVAINYDGSATAQIEGRFDLPPRSQQFPPGTIDTKTLQSLLTAVGDVSKIPTTGFRSKPASFATTTKISYEGNTSGDLQCFPQNGVGGDPAQLQADGNLVKFVETTLQQLKISVLPQPVSKGDVAVLSVSNSDCTFHVEIQNDGSAKGAVCFKTHPLAEERNYPAGTFDTTCLLSFWGGLVM